MSEDRDSSNGLLDVVVIGGGPAGLSAALSLVRARRRVVVVDAGRPRNRFAAHMHGVLGHDHLPPTRLLELGRTEIEGYGGRIVTGEVRDIRLADPAIEVATADDATGDGMLRARRLLVATGLTDELPDIPGLGEQWGRGVVTCPYCDGWEHRNDVIGLLASMPANHEGAQMLRQWSDRVVYLPNGIGDPSPEDLERLGQRGIRVEPGVVTRLVVDADDRVTGVEVDGRHVAVDVIFTPPTLRPNDALLRALGASVSVDQPGRAGEWVDVDADGRTSVDRVWAVGNVVDQRSNVPVSMGAGSLIAGAINSDLLAEDIELAGQRG
ncbi:NAD(P)/FAD-dependent oxidoreductase [Agromyces sp. LHK192]|uniref:NAD(P)/FAD-dependent oxidoreductase n=1 Tax=Agromyces sp. LHK192 TaxID=2498704 RepID=UPI00196AE144|nr:NAD(P)/FAD-dependent oxidoreductase [Agromyces sp. LHK192]